MSGDDHGQNHGQNKGQDHKPGSSETAAHDLKNVIQGFEQRTTTENGVLFSSGENRLVGIVSQPREPARLGVLILVGGPQYRVGAHRQFTLLARSLADQGIASLRFDYAGMGDSEGERSTFEETQGDIFAAIETLQEQCPALEGIVLWGLCDAASTAMMYGYRFPQVKGMVALNPWVHSGDYSPGFRLSHYYRPLLTERGYWRRVLFGQVQMGPALKDLAKATFSRLGSGQPEGLTDGSIARFCAGRCCRAYSVLPSRY